MPHKEMSEHIAIHLPVHKRPGVTKIAYTALERTRAEFHELGFTTSVHVGGTTDNDQKLALEFGYDFVKLPNEPIGRKFNLLLHRIVDTQPFDWLMEYGSDNVLAVGYAEKAKAMMDEGCRAFGLTDFYIANFRDTSIRLFDKGFSNIGRFTRRPAILKMKRTRGEWYNWRLNRKIDQSFFLNHRRVAGPHKAMPCETPQLLDIKDMVNINPLSDYLNRKVVPLAGEFPEFINAHPTWQPQAKSGPTQSESTSAPPKAHSQPESPAEPLETQPTKTTRGNSSPAPRPARSRGRSKSSTRRRKTMTDKGKSSPADSSGA